MPLNLTKMQKDELSHHLWRVSTNDTITQQAITEALAAQGEDSGSTTNIFHTGKSVPVFIVDFKIVFFLANNKYKTPYSFTAYHRKNRSGGWHVWREGRETHVQKLLKELPVTSEDLKEDALKKKKRDNLLAKKLVQKKHNGVMKKSALAAM